MTDEEPPTQNAATAISATPAQALVTYPPPGVAKLSDAQREPFRSIIVALEAANFDPKAIDGKLPSLITQMKLICSTDDDQRCMINQLGDWVRWHRLAGYYLSYMFQASMQPLGANSFVPACLLFADAQNQLGEDLSIISLENAYTAWQSYCDATGTEARASEALSAVGADLRRRLRMTYGYYRKWYSPESYANINQLAESLYFEKAWIDLKQAFPELYGSFTHHGSVALQSVIDRCASPEDAYCRVVARRILGLVQAGAGDFAVAEDAYRKALVDAQSVKLDAEIGHLHRLLGWALMKLGRLDEAELEHRKAFTHDRHPKFSYWQALTFGEIGDVRLRRLGGAFDPAKPPHGSAAVAEAYANSRYAFENDIARCVLPVTRAVKQQMMRSYADNAVQLAVTGPEEVMTAIETFGPRYANDLVAEGRVAETLDAPSYDRFREARAIVHRDLAALSTNVDLDSALDIYLADVVAHRAERQYYFQFRNAHGVQIAKPQLAATVANETLALRIPRTVLLLVNVERVQMHVVIVDASSGTPLLSSCVQLDDHEWRQAHGAYDAAVRAASRGAADPAPAMRQALDALLEFYEEVFGGVLEPLAQALEGRHLKIFPRCLMNQVPLHAVRLGSKRLIDICDVSYAPSLTLFLQVHQENAALAPGTLTILHDAARTHSYAGTVRALTAEAPDAIVTVPGPSWQNFRTSLEQHATSDILFACHGRFDGDDPSRSRLEVTRTQPIDFAQMFTDLDLRGYRSVLMGACESGLGRTLVSAEYIGLPMAFLAAGVRYVIGALWQVTQLPAAILVASHCALLIGGTRPVVNCLNEAARRLKAMSRDDVMAWVQQFLPEKAAEVEAYLLGLEDSPFAHPYYWAGFYASGDA